MTVVLYSLTLQTSKSVIVTYIKTFPSARRCSGNSSLPHLECTPHNPEPSSVRTINLAHLSFPELLLTPSNIRTLLRLDLSPACTITH